MTETLQIITSNSGLAIAVAGAAVAISLGGIGSIIGVSSVGTMGAALISEKPESYGKVILMVVLPGTQGIYGFLGAFWIMLKLKILEGNPILIDPSLGWVLFFSMIPVALTGLLSGIYQGKVARAGINVIAKDPANSGKAVILAAMVETYAVLGLLVTILLVNGIQVG